MRMRWPILAASSSAASLFYIRKQTHFLQENEGHECVQGFKYVYASLINAVASSHVANLTQRVATCDDSSDDPDENLMLNYSGTHAIVPGVLHRPDNQQELEQIVSHAHKAGTSIRPVGTFLSPNGIASSDGGMVAMSNLDRIINVDSERQEITVEGGVVVSTVLEALEPYGLTLANFSSIKEQQMAGWTQVAAHGTGARLPTVDEMIVRMKLITPAQGVLDLSDTSESRELFRLARCGLGSLGIVSEMTLKCVPSHRLREVTVTKKASEIKADHNELLQNHRHVRYMWIPHTDTVVVVLSDPPDDPAVKKHPQAPIHSGDALLPIKNLLGKLTSSPASKFDGLPLAELRDRLVDISPLDTQHITAVNQAEADVWKNSQGVREGKSDEILGFDCGGQQWVLEMAFPTGTLQKNTQADVDFVLELKTALEQAGIPAPSPIEQRWTSASTSYFSPAYSENKDDIFSWVGIIMYMPPGQGESQRAEITKRFEAYADIMRTVGKKYGIVPHWAKIELPSGSNKNSCELSKTQELRRVIRQRYDVARFNKARRMLDPKGILSNDLINTVFDE